MKVVCYRCKGYGVVPDHGKMRMGMPAWSCCPMCKGEKEVEESKYLKKIDRKRKERKVRS